MLRSHYHQSASCIKNYNGASLFVQRYQVQGRVRVGSTNMGTQAAGVQCKVDSSLRSVDIFVSPCCFSYCLGSGFRSHDRGIRRKFCQARQRMASA